MQYFRLRGAVLALGLLTATGVAVVTEANLAYGQSAVTGAVSGVVSDATGAVVPNATVTVTNAGTNATQTVSTNGEGRYTVGLLSPGAYRISATAQGLQSQTVQVNVLVGTTIPGDVKVTPNADKTVVEVTASTLPLVDTENVALATTFNEQQIQELPTPGGDVTTVAFTAPGVVVNAGGSYGNFSSDGLPGISNLYVMNGFDNQDPFLNLNNSGSSNLTLGQGELAEATVVQNGYNSQYGRAAGAIINYTTKSGTNRFHGMADYNYNGTALNANGWFNNHYAAGRPHAVSNQWAVNAGGPIIKDKLFFFADYEGLRYVLPGASGLVNFPSPEFQAATLANIPVSAQPLYQQVFAAYQGAPSYKKAQPIATGGDTLGGCGANLTGVAVPGGGGATFGNDVPCMTQTFAETNNINKEWLFTGRADWNISDRHKIYGRYKMDRGSQPTSTSFINPLFSTISTQPEYEGQFNDTYVISPTKTNVFVAAGNWYTAYFGPENVAASQAAMPWSFYTDLGFDNSGTSTQAGLTELGAPYYFPQGRNVTQYQFDDDFAWIHGKHSIKVGANFRRDLISDYDAQQYTDFPLQETFSLDGFYAGTNTPSTGEYIQNFANQTTAHLAIYNLGVYIQDEWQALPNLKLTVGARVDRTGNPLCHQSCFSAYQGSFPNSNASLDQPYDVAAGGSINAANAHPFTSVEVFNFQPRFGFNYAIGQRTEIRGGAGLFSDLYPAGFLDGAIQNFPNVNQVFVLNGALGNSGAGTVTNDAAAANAALQTGFTAGQSFNQINAALTAQGIPFTAPPVNAYFPSEFRVPEYVEYSLQLQRQISRMDAITVTYAGNYGYNGILQNPYQNPAGPLAGVPAVAPDPSFTRVTAYTNSAHSNYNGGMVTYKHTGGGLTGQVSYTYSHSLDMVSNGGSGEYFNTGSVTTQLAPTTGYGNLNYSNSDYDIRHNLTADLVYEEPFFQHGNVFAHNLLGGWVLGAKTYYRSGEPFTLYNGELANSGFTNLGTSFMVEAAGAGRLTNRSGANPKACIDAGNCLDAAQYVDPSAQTTFGNVRRNAVYGPHYANTDLSLMKKVINKERITFQIGANAYNAFNHANFANPNSTLGTASFGTITSVVSPPTSPYGSFQSAAVTQRVLQVHGKITF